MDISEQVKEQLRELADDMEKYVGLRPKPNVLRNAANIIESLSEKLQAANMERPAEDCSGGYRPNKQPCVICKDHKGGKPFMLRDDSGQEHLFSHISNCPYCGRFLSENYNVEKSLSKAYQDDGGWTYCGDGNNLPTEPLACIVTVIDTEPMTQADFESILPYHVGYDGKQWNDIKGNRIPFEVIAWMYAPKEPYHKP